MKECPDKKIPRSAAWCYTCGAPLPINTADGKRAAYDYIKHSDKTISYLCPKCAAELKKDARAFTHNTLPTF